MMAESIDALGDSPGDRSKPPDPPEHTQTMKQGFPALPGKLPNSFAINQQVRTFIKHSTYESYTRFLELNFNKTDRRRINPYQVKK